MFKHFLGETISLGESLAKIKLFLIFTNVHIIFKTYDVYLHSSSEPVAGAIFNLFIQLNSDFFAPFMLALKHFHARAVPRNKNIFFLS